VRLTELNIYPVKSCGPLAVDAATVEPRGLAGDRRFMLVDSQGRFLTQRQHPQMALLSVAAMPHGLRVTVPDADPLDLPRTLHTNLERRVRVWDSELPAAVADENINIWFTRFMGFPVELVFMGSQHERPLKAGRGRAADRVSFADGAPVLMISEGSLAELNGRLAKPVTMARFRPNMVVTADKPFAEDEWRRIRIGGAEFEVAWACTRCVLTTIDPVTGVKGPDGEPLNTLRGFRRVSAGVIFGQNLIPRRLGRVQVGDRVRVLQGR
jgi:uncharacterized protein YcbX